MIETFLLIFVCGELILTDLNHFFYFLSLTSIVTLQTSEVKYYLHLESIWRFVIKCFVNDLTEEVGGVLGMKMGIDFGSTNFTVFAEGKGIVMSEPSVVICDSFSGKPLVMGNAAKKMLGKLPDSMYAVNPIKDGIVNNYDIACTMLRTYLNKLCATKLFRPNILMCVPSTVTELEKKTIFDAVIDSGAARACFVDESLAAAIGSGVSLTQPQGTFICDIGGGTADCAVVTMGNIAVSANEKVGGNDFTKTISDYIFHEHNIEVGYETAENIKRTVGTAVFRNEEVAIMAGGKSCETGLPVLFEITSTEVYWILKSHIEHIFKCIKNVFEETPPELISDIFENGIILTGGTANLYGLDRYIEWNTGIRTFRAEQPENCAVLGLGRLLKDLHYLENNGYIFKSREDDDDEEE